MSWDHSFWQGSLGTLCAQLLNPERFLELFRLQTRGEEMKRLIQHRHSFHITRGQAWFWSPSSQHPSMCFGFLMAQQCVHLSCCAAGSSAPRPAAVCQQEAVIGVYPNPELADIRGWENVEACALMEGSLPALHQQKPVWPFSMGTQAARRADGTSGEMQEPPPPPWTIHGAGNLHQSPLESMQVPL